MVTYTNGNTTINLADDGTRIIDFDGELQLEYPLNIDIRVQTICPLGYNPKTQSAGCSFCHESARTDGSECDYNVLLDKLRRLPSGIELAIGCNIASPNLLIFLTECNKLGFIGNLTVNQALIGKYQNQLLTAIKQNDIKGLGISYRSFANLDINSELLDYDNTVWHVICGIDSFNDVYELHNHGVKKILVLGEKDFGFNTGNVDLMSVNHLTWFRNVRKLFDIFDVVSFDNLALEQLKINRFLSESDWNTFHQGEYSFYINAVNGYYSPSSRNPSQTDWNTMSVTDYFATLLEKQK